MTYDFDGAVDRSPPKVEIQTTRPDDLETIVTLLELAAIFLTTTPKSTFTEAELFREAQELGGGEIRLNEVDVKIVLSTSKFLTRNGDRLSLK